jgi:hypothetical protein
MSELVASVLSELSAAALGRKVFEGMIDETAPMAN